MKNSSLFVLTLIVFSIACSTEREKKRRSPNEIEYDTSTTAIIEWDSNLNYPFNAIDYERATLTQNDIVKIDTALVTAVATWNRDLSKEFQIDLSGRNYMRQLVAVKNDKGQKEVWVNYFCSHVNVPWKKQLLNVEDGGSCFFEFKLICLLEWSTTLGQTATRKQPLLQLQCRTKFLHTYAATFKLVFLASGFFLM